MITIKNNAFTLVEVIIVAVIVGILAGIVLPQYTKAVERNRSKEAKTNLRLIAAAEQQYYMEYSAYTATSSSISQINDLLRLSIAESANMWTYSVVNSGVNLTTNANRTDGPYSGCVYTLTVFKNNRVIGEPTGSNCP